jgi:hypothetical protein
MLAPLGISMPAEAFEALSVKLMSTLASPPANVVMAAGSADASVTDQGLTKRPSRTTARMTHDL